jgi:phage tail-like protein
VTHDVDFEKWANLAFSFGGQMSLKDFRKDILIEMFNEQDVKVISYKVYRCWVSEYMALPELDANAHAVAIQSITIENEGWERDTDVKEPKET